MSTVCNLMALSFAIATEPHQQRIQRQSRLCTCSFDMHLSKRGYMPVMVLHTSAAGGCPTWCDQMPAWARSGLHSPAAALPATMVRHTSAVGLTALMRGVQYDMQVQTPIHASMVARLEE